MPRRLGRQIGDRRDNFSRQSFFLLAMATKTVAAWSAVNASEIDKKVSFFRFACKSQTQEGDFYGVLQFLDSGFIEKWNCRKRSLIVFIPPPPQPLSGNSSFDSYFLLKILAFETPPPLSWIWLFSETTRNKTIGLINSFFKKSACHNITNYFPTL